jgi:hypothetical protein
MKQKILVSVLGLLGGLTLASSSWAAGPWTSSTPEFGHSSRGNPAKSHQTGLLGLSKASPTPTAVVPSSNPPVSSSGSSPSSTSSSSSGASIPPRTLSPLHQLSQKTWHQMIQIQMDLKSGKMTQAQAKTVRAQIKAVREQELGFLKANGNHQLTGDQFTQLNGQLDTVNQSIPVR